MASYAVLGLGMMGKAICHDILINNSSSIVLGFDLDIQQRAAAEKQFKSYKNQFRTYELNLSVDEKPNESLLLQIFKEHNIQVAFGAIDYKFNIHLTKICILAKINFLDLGGNREIVEAQKRLNTDAKKANILIIPDCGLAPGMANILAANAMKHFDSLESCNIRVGGLPQNPETILKYSQFFSIRGLTNEYLEDSVIIRDGKIQFIPSLTEIETLEFPKPWGTMEAFQTSGGTSSLPELFEGKIDELTYKTIRYPGHCQFIQYLKEFSLLSSKPYPNYPKISPREVVEYYLQKHLPQNVPDVVLVRIIVKGRKDNNYQKFTYQIIDLKDNISDLSAMARTTAFPISIIGQMIVNDKIDIKGVVSGELAVPAELFIKELKFRSINIEKTIENLDVEHA